MPSGREWGVGSGERTPPPPSAPRCSPKPKAAAVTTHRTQARQPPQAGTGSCVGGGLLARYPQKPRKAKSRWNPRQLPSLLAQNPPLSLSSPESPVANASPQAASSAINRLCKEPKQHTANKSSTKVMAAAGLQKGRVQSVQDLDRDRGASAGTMPSGCSEDPFQKVAHRRTKVLPC